MLPQMLPEETSFLKQFSLYLKMLPQVTIIFKKLHMYIYTIYIYIY